MASINLKNVLITNRDRNIDLYFKDIASYELLSIQDENNLFNIIKRGLNVDPNDENYEQIKEDAEKAKKKLIESNQRFIVSVAKRASNNNNNLLLDLINEGNIGLITAIDKFNPSLNIRFLTYAVHWIHRQMHMYLMFKNNAIRQTNVSKTTHNVSKIQNRFFMDNGRLPETDELIEILEKEYNISIKQTTDLLNLQILSIDIPESEENVSSDSEFNEKYFEINAVEVKNDNEYYKHLFKKYFSRIDKRSQEIIKLHYGLDGQKEMTLRQIGEKLNLTSERVRQIHKETLDKFKRMMRNEKWN